MYLRRWERWSRSRGRRSPKTTGTTENVNPNLLNNYTMVTILGSASAEGVSARRKVLENQK